jgi:hypothetical protein
MYPVIHIKLNFLVVVKFHFQWLLVSLVVTGFHTFQVVPENYFKYSSYVLW